MDIAVKFCGGCNPRYDRKRVYDKILTNLSKCNNFSGVDLNKKYDILIIIKGCYGCDDNYDEVNATHKFFIYSEEDADKVISQIASLS